MPRAEDDAALLDDHVRLSRLSRPMASERSIYDTGGDGGGAGGGGEPEPEPKPGFFASMSMGYDELVNAIIRPPRAEYDVADLGAREMRLGPITVTRRDLELEGQRGKLVCSHWEPGPSSRTAEQLRMPCVIYMHGNCGCRAEALEILPLVIGGGMTLFSFDFGGCGKSEGEHISLGWWEREDLGAVVSHLRECGTVSTIGLWGRSMGAVTALLHGDRDPSIAAMVLDSPFCSLRELAGELVSHLDFKIPSFAVSAALSFVKSSVKKRAGFNVDELAPVKHADACFIPALFGHAEDDDFILKRHSEAIHEKYAGDKNLVTFDGDHNSRRPEWFYHSALNWLQATMLQGATPPSVSSPPVMFSPRHGGAAPDDAQLAAEMMKQAQAASGAEGAAAAGYYPSTAERLGGIGLPLAAGTTAGAEGGGGGGDGGGEGAREAAASEPAVDPTIVERMVTEMGLGREESERAAAATGYRGMAEAIEWHFSNPGGVAETPAADGAPGGAAVDLGGQWEDDAAAQDAELQSALALSMQTDAQADGAAAEGAAASAEQPPPPQEQPPAVAQPPTDASPPVAEAAAGGGEAPAGQGGGNVEGEAVAAPAVDLEVEAVDDGGAAAEAAAVAQLSELFGEALSDEEARRALQARNGNLELAFGDLASRLSS